MEIKGWIFGPATPYINLQLLFLPTLANSFSAAVVISCVCVLIRFTQEEFEGLSSHMAKSGLIKVCASTAVVSFIIL